MGAQKATIRFYKLNDLSVNLEIYDYDLSAGLGFEKSTINKWRNLSMKFTEGTADVHAKKIAIYLIKNYVDNKSKKFEDKKLLWLETEVGGKLSSDNIDIIENNAKSIVKSKDSTKKRDNIPDNSKDSTQESDNILERSIDSLYNSKDSTEKSIALIAKWLLNQTIPDSQATKTVNEQKSQFADLKKSLNAILDKQDLNIIDKASDDIDKVMHELFYFSKQYESSNSELSTAAMEIVNHYYKEFGPAYNKYVESNGKEYEKEAEAALESLVSIVNPKGGEEEPIKTTEPSATATVSAADNVIDN